MLNISAIGIFCEDIREEKQETDTIVGILPENINIDSVPGVIPKLCIYIRVHFTIDQNVDEISVNLVLPNGKRIDLGKIDRELIEKTRTDIVEQGGVLIGLIAKAKMQNFIVHECGINRLLLIVDGNEYLAATLHVHEKAGGREPAKSTSSAAGLRSRAARPKSPPPFKAGRTTRRRG